MRGDYKALIKIRMCSLSKKFITIKDFQLNEVIKSDVKNLHTNVSGFALEFRVSFS